ncbi:MAG: transglutaminase-like cysteine peptidase [Sphingomonas sp.]|uniref:transglutaminase-like cysteine peptidase n=1 Tax=Sphingomonas sp. TaxID=28214 RepID=UPI001826175E|nr:transglutaminase-like cysteine peptidase [Sphingomonas sp.]MBA3667593.1 transglutaminase-like cysteine peptidase [Sphingomonas sp.]
MATRFLKAMMLASIAVAPLPAAAAETSSNPPQQSFLKRTTNLLARAVTAPIKPDVFGTVALAAGVTLYDARWRRVSAADQSDPRVLAMAATLRGLDPLAKLSAIQADVGRRIAWRRDLDGYHIADYWAEAGETLNRGFGDSEDIAILKIQALKAAGFDPRDLYISVGKDKSRGLDTLLIARAGGRFYVLDDRGPAPMQSEQYGRFDPIITLGKNATWLHGRRFHSFADRAARH